MTVEFSAPRSYPQMIWMQSTTVPLRSLTFQLNDPRSYVVLLESPVLWTGSALRRSRSRQVCTASSVLPLCAQPS